MKGHWLSQTRKLNRHYQSGEIVDKSGKSKLSPEEGCIYKVVKNDTKYYPAPSYCVLKDGKMLQEISYDRNYSASGVEGIEISEEQVLEYVPYIPKDSDDYYVKPIIDKKPVIWKAEKAFDVIEGDAKEKIVSFLAGEDLSSKNANLIKLTYGGYVIKKKGINYITGDEFFKVCEKLAEKLGGADIDGEAFYTGYDTVGYGGSWYGKLSWGKKDGQGFHVMEDFTGNIGFFSHDTDKHVFKYPAMTIQPQYLDNEYWNGEQKISEIVSSSITPYIVYDSGAPVGMHGSSIKPLPAYIHKHNFSVSDLYDFKFNARFSPFQILKKVEVITCPITG